MASQPDPIAPPRAPLSRDRVLEAAIALADANGIESLTMRRLAQDLGVEAMTLYYYVKNKDDLLNGIVDLVVREFELPSPDAHWKVALRRTAISAHEALVRHLWAATAMLSTNGVGQARMRYIDSVLGTLRGAGLSAELTDHAYHALDSHIMGFTLWDTTMDLGSEEDLAAMGAAFLRTFPRDEMPHLAEHVEQHMRVRSPDEVGDFEFGLDLILDGLERIREAP